MPRERLEGYRTTESSVRQCVVFPYRTTINRPSDTAIVLYGNK